MDAIHPTVDPIKTRFTFTKNALSTLPIPQPGKRLEVRDKMTPGLLLRVTHTGAKSFVVYRRINGGKPQRVTLGRFTGNYDGMTIEQARKKAASVLAQMVEGVDPIKKRRADEQSGITLQTVFNDYLRSRSNLKPATVKDYERNLKEAFDDWKDNPIAGIDKEAVQRRFERQTKKSKARANNAFRMLRALLNFAHHAYDDEHGKPIFTSNPATILSHAKSWHKIAPRKNFVKAHELPAWFAATLNLEADRSSFDEDAATARDFFLFLALTGLRAGEAMGLTWDRVDLKDRSYFLDDPKNREAVALPLSDYLVRLLRVRKAASKSKWVFPASDPSNPITDTRAWQAKIAKTSKTAFTPHALRRTFITVAESTDISAYCLKRLVNHRIDQGDVTDRHYLAWDVERLRAAMEAITQRFLQLANIQDMARGQGHG